MPASHSTEQLSPWAPLLASLLPILRNQTATGSGPMYPGVMAAQQSPMQIMARQMAMQRAGGQMPRQNNPFAQPGYQTGDLGRGGMDQMGRYNPNAGGPGQPGGKGGGGPMGPMMQGGQGGFDPSDMGGAGGVSGPPPGDQSDHWFEQLKANGMWPGFQSLMGSAAPFFTPAANPYAPFGGQNPSQKGEFLTPLLQEYGERAKNLGESTADDPRFDVVLPNPNVNAGRQ